MSSLVHADLADNFQQNCNTFEVKELLGTTGSCRIVIAPKKIEKSGVCTGIMNNFSTCTVNYITSLEGAVANLICGIDLRFPLTSVDLGADAFGYSVATLIKKADGQDVVQSDRNEYSQITNRMVELNLVESKSLNGVPTTTATFFVTLNKVKTQLTDVVCK